MHLMQDKMVTDWAYFARCVNERFDPPTRGNPLDKLASLQKTGTVCDYTQRFMAHVVHAETLDEQQWINIYTAGFLVPPGDRHRALEPKGQGDGHVLGASIRAACGCHRRR
jgi:hypothetical protein